MRKTFWPQYHRITRIVQLIRAGTRNGKYPNAADFCADLGVSRWTVLRDLDFLRDEENAPIEYVASRHGYRFSDETWDLPAMSLSTREVFAFAVARKLVQRFRGTPWETDIATVLDKISESLEGSVTVDVETLTERFTVLGEDYVVQDPEIWGAVARFLERCERVRILYQKFDGQTGHYELDPYHLLSFHGNWYVLARRVDKDRVQTFAISRIREIAAVGHSFRRPQDFDVQQHIDKSFGIVRGEKVLRVRLRFSPRVATYIRERVWHPTQRIVQKRDGSIDLILETGGWKELVRWILSWQPDCVVLAPKRLRDRVEEKMRQALAAQRRKVK